MVESAHILEEKPKEIRPNPLAMMVSQLPRIGEKTTAALEKGQITNIFDLLLRVPKSVVNQEEAEGFFQMEAGRTYVAKGIVFATKTTGFGPKKRLGRIVSSARHCLAGATDLRTKSLPSYLHCLAQR